MSNSESPKIQNFSDMHFNSNVAKKYTIMAALVLNRILWSIKFHQDDPQTYGHFYIDEKWWMKNTYEALANYFGGIIAQRTIREIVLKFENDGILISRQMRSKSWSHEKWYTADSKKCAQLMGLAIEEEKPLGDTKNPIITDEAKNVTSDFVDGTVACPIDGTVACPIDETRAASSSSLKSHARNQKKNPRSPRPSVPTFPSWPKDHDFACIFEQLTKLAVCAKQFDLKKYDMELQALKKELAISNEEILKCATDWQRWHNEPGGKKPQKAWMSFEAWVKRSVKWHGTARKGDSKQAKPLQETFEDSVSWLQEHKKNRQLKEESIG